LVWFVVICFSQFGMFGTKKNLATLLASAKIASV
jgi:hypothetical protein